LVLQHNQAMTLQVHRISLSQRKWSEHWSLGFTNNLFESEQTYGVCATLLFYVAWISMCCMPCFIFSPMLKKGCHDEQGKLGILF